MRLTGASLAGNEDADAFDHLGWRARSLGEEDIGCTGAIKGSDGSGDDHCGKRGLKMLGAAYQFVAIHLGHEEIAEQKVE